MDDVIGQVAWDRMSIGSGRQCSATSKSTGERCRRAPIVGGFVCDHHGGKIPAVRKSARERLLAMVDPALDALLRALQTGPPCEHCGRSDSDKDPVVLRAAQLVLDRAGHHPTISVEQAPKPNPYDGLSEDEIIERLERTLDAAKQARDERRLQAAPPAIEGFLVPEDEPIHELTVPIPSGNDAPDERKEA
jgi:hypothetical protein